MKEATGELTTTVVAVVAVAAILVLFSTIVYPALQERINNKVNEATTTDVEVTGITNNNKQNANNLPTGGK